MFVQAIHVDAAREFSAIGVNFNRGQYVFDDKGRKGRITFCRDGDVQVCWNLRRFGRKVSNSVLVTFYFAEHQETLRLKRSEIEAAEDYLSEEHGECFTIKVKP